MGKYMSVLEIIESAKNIAVTLNEVQAQQFSRYFDLLREWNQRINLTAIVDEQGVLLRHFIDSLTVLRALPEAINMLNSMQSLRVIDIGTGAGFPGIPLKIARPDLEVTLVDGTAKKLRFCDEVIAQLGLRNIQTLQGRAEDLGHENEHREAYDVVVARAVAPLPTLLEYLLPLTHIGGCCVAMKGSEAEVETAQAAPAITKLGGQLKRVEQVALPGLPDKRALIIIDKVSPTLHIYPRPGGAPRNSPLGG